MFVFFRSGPDMAASYIPDRAFDSTRDPIKNRCCRRMRYLERAEPVTPMYAVRIRVFTRLSVAAIVESR